MTGFLHHLIAAARWQRHGVRPRPVSPFETAVDPAPPVVEVEVPGPPRRPARTAKAPVTTPVAATRLQDQPVSRPVPGPPRPVEETEPAKAPRSPHPRAPRVQTIRHVIHEIRSAAPEPIPPGPADPAVPAPRRRPDRPETGSAEVAAAPPPGSAADPPHARHDPVEPQAVKALAPEATVTSRLPSQPVPPIERPVAVRRVETECRTVETRKEAVATGVPPGRKKPEAVKTGLKPAGRTPAPPVLCHTPAATATETAGPAPVPAVSVSIGTVEIRAVAAPRQKEPSPRPGAPKPLSLDDYLKQRDRGGFQ